MISPNDLMEVFTSPKQAAWFQELLQKSDEVIELEMQVAKLNMQNAELHLFALSVVQMYRRLNAQKESAASPPTPQPEPGP